MAWRYHVQRAVTNTWLHRDAIMLGTNLEWTLSGPGALSASLDAVAAKEIAGDGILLFDEWSSLIYAEEDDIIRWGGIVDSSTDMGNGARQITARSFSGYPEGRVYLDELRYYETDGFDLIRMLWGKLQEDPLADLDVQLSQNKSGITIGSAAPGDRPVQQAGETLEAYEARVVQWQSAINEPYELAWWNTPDYGNEIDNLIIQTGGAYTERHAWTGVNKDAVSHDIDLHFPLAGNRRADLRFVEGENVFVPPLPSRDGLLYGNYVIALGAGEDRHTLRHEIGRQDGRLRRDIVAPSKGTYSPSLLQRMAQDTLDDAQQIMKYDTIEVLDHPNAPLGSWQLGDDLFLQTHSGFEQINDWVRLVGWSMAPDNPDRATLKTVRI